MRRKKTNSRIFSIRSLKNYLLCKTAANDLTCAVKSITGVPKITGAIEAARYVDTSCKLAASSVVFSTFIHVWQCIILQYLSVLWRQVYRGYKLAQYINTIGLTNSGTCRMVSGFSPNPVKSEALVIGTVNELQAITSAMSTVWGDWKCKTWKMQDLENDGPNRRAGICRTWNMTDEIAEHENAGPGKWRTKSHGWKMQNQIILPLVGYVLIHWTTNSCQNVCVLTQTSQKWKRNKIVMQKVNPCAQKNEN